MALSDAFVLAWATKYEYNQIRPITYIQRVIDPAWNRPVVLDPVLTPPFPDYPSGHATECGAAMQVLTDLFGNDYAFVDRSHERLGYVARAFPSFNAAAEEAAVSRLYGGIHYPSSNEQGLVAGRCIAGQIMALKMKE
jgi:membrane-associated phospholipid phosphatase